MQAYSGRAPWATLWERHPLMVADGQTRDLGKPSTQQMAVRKAKARAQIRPLGQASNLPAHTPNSTAAQRQARSTEAHRECSHPRQVRATAQHTLPCQHRIAERQQPRRSERGAQRRRPIQSPMCQSTSGRSSTNLQSSKSHRRRVRSYASPRVRKHSRGRASTRLLPATSML